MRPRRDTWWRRALSWVRVRAPHLHLWRAKTVTASVGRTRFQVEERTCRCGERRTIGSPPPGPSPLQLSKPMLLDTGVLRNSHGESSPMNPAVEVKRG